MKTQRDFARLLGVSDVVVSQWLKALRTPSLDMAVRIRQHTGITEESWLLTTLSVTDESVAASTAETKL